MRRVLYISVWLSTVHTHSGSQFPASQTLGPQPFGSQFGGTDLVESRPAYSSKPAVNANAALEPDDPIYDDLNTSSGMAVPAKHRPSSEHHYSQAAPTHAVAAPSQPSVRGQDFQASSQPAAPVQGFQVSPQQEIPGQYAVQAPTQLTQFLGNKPSLHEVVKAAPVPLTYRKRVSCETILEQSAALDIPNDTATSFRTLLSEINETNVSGQTEKNVLAIFDSMTDHADSSKYAILEHMNTCEVDEGGNNVFQRLIRINMVKPLNSYFVINLLLKSDEEPFLVVDNHNNNVLHLAVMTGNPMMLKTVVALHDKYQKENNGPASNGVTFLASALEAKNKAGKTPRDLANSMRKHDLLVAIQDLYRMNSLIAGTFR